MEGSENNPVMFELMSELPWRTECKKEDWIKGYVKARYGKTSPEIERAWQLLSETIVISNGFQILQTPLVGKCLTADVHQIIFEIIVPFILISDAGHKLCGLKCSLWVIIIAHL